MDRALKQRLIGAAVLVAIAVIFLPMLVKGPAPVSGAADVSLEVPAAPKDGFETRDLPLGAPGQVPAGGVAGMTETPATGAPQPASTLEPASTPATAAGDYAVNFGHYGTSADADRMVAALGQSQLQAYAEPSTLNGRSAWRVRLGPYASRAEAEAARLRALHVTDKVNASVVALNADVASASTAAATPPAAVTTAPLPPAPRTTETAAPAPKPVAVADAKPAPTPAKPVQPEPKPAAAPKPATPVATAPKPEPKPVAKAAETQPAEPKPAPKPAASNVGFAVQLGAFADAAAANALRDKARAAGLSAFTETIKTAEGPRTRVRIGPVADRADAEKLRAQAQSKLGVGGMVRPHP